MRIRLKRRRTWQGFADCSNRAIYWEGLSELIDSNGKRVGSGYLEMRGYAGVLRM